MTIVGRGPGRSKAGIRARPPATRRLDVLVVLNPVAPRYPSAELRAAIESACASRGLHVRIVETPPGDDARTLIGRRVRRAIQGGCRLVIAAGGDGTVAMTAAHLVNARRGSPRAALAIIPAGTANVLGRELGLPTSLADVVALALDAERTLDLDVIMAGERLILTQVGIGPDAMMMRDMVREEQQRYGRFAYALAFMRRAAAFQARWFNLEVDGKPMRVRAWQLVVANVGAAGTPPFTWGPGIDPSDGALDLCIFDARTPRDYLTLAWRLMTGHHRRDPQTRFVRVREQVTIQSARPIPIQGDGEVLGRTPVSLRILPGALRVRVARAMEDVHAADSASGEARRSPGTAADGALDAAAPVVAQVETMLALHSRTWVLQGVLQHPLAALEALDAALYLKINTWVLGRWPDRALLILSKVMHYGEGWAVVAIIMLATNWHAGLRTTGEALVVLWATMLTVNFPLKQLFRRRRPFLAFVTARVTGPKPIDHSLPSGHTAAAFAGALLFGIHAPAWSPLFYTLAVLVGFSRVYLGVHYPSDVAIGAATGMALAWGYRLLLGLLLSRAG